MHIHIRSILIRSGDASNHFPPTKQTTKRPPSRYHTTLVYVVQNDRQQYIRPTMRAYNNGSATAGHFCTLIIQDVVANCTKTSAFSGGTGAWRPPFWQATSPRRRLNYFFRSLWKIMTLSTFNFYVQITACATAMCELYI